MAAHYTREAGTIRFYPEGSSYQARDEFDGVVSVKWLDDRTAELHAGLGTNGLDRLQEAIAVLMPLGANRFRVKRAARRKMPRPWRIVERGESENTWELDLADGG